MSDDRLLEHLEIVSAAQTGGRCADRSEIEQVPVPRLVHDVGQLLDGHDVGEVDDRACDGRDGDAVARRDVTEIESIAPMDADAVDAAPPGRDHSDPRAASPTDSPQRRGGAVGERRALTGGEHGGQPARLA